MNNGWNTDKLESLLNALREAYDLEYEIRNCYRGAYTNVETYKDLGECVKELGNRLIQEGSWIAEEVEEEDYEEEGYEDEDFL